MAIESLGKNEYWQAKVDWAPLRKWYREGDVGVDLPEDMMGEYGIYRFEGHYDNGDPKKLLYIGIAYDQSFDTRLHQGYHASKMKYKKAKEIYVSVGSIELTNTIHTREGMRILKVFWFISVNQNLTLKRKCGAPNHT